MSDTAWGWVLGAAVGTGLYLFSGMIERHWSARMAAKAQARQRSQPAGGLAFGCWALAGPEALASITHAFWSGASPEQLAHFRQHQQAAIEEIGGFRFAWAAPRPREVAERLGLLLGEHLRQRVSWGNFEPAEAYRLALQTGLLAAVAMAEAYEQERVPEGGRH